MFKYKKAYNKLRKDIQDLQLAQGDLRRTALEALDETPELDRPEVSTKAAKHAYAEIMCASILVQMDKRENE